MSCNCVNNLSEKVEVPTGMKALWLEHKVPICVSGAVILGAIGYGVFLRKKDKN